MYEIRRSVTFAAWLTNLNDSNARARIAARIDRLAMGNPGDVKPVGSGISESPSTMVRVIASISRGWSGLCIYCFAVEPRTLRTQISNEQSK